MLYSNYESFLLQERGGDKSEFDLEILEPANFNIGSLQFPLVSNDYVIKLLQGDYDYYYNPGNSTSYELYICPPYNSHTISTSQYPKDSGYRNKDEFFSPDDPSKIIRIINNNSAFIVNIVSQSGVIESQKKLASEVAYNASLLISQNGRYVCAYSIEYQQGDFAKTVWKAKSYEISINAGSETGSHRENSKHEELNDGGMKKQYTGTETKPEDMLNIYPVKDITLEAVGDAHFSPYTIFKQKLLNNGDYIHVDLRNERFFVNDVNYYPELFTLIQKNIKDAKRTKVMKTENEKQVEVLSNGFEIDKYEIGQDYLIIWTEKVLYSVRFGQLGPNKKFFYKFNKLRMIPVTEYRDITMESITATSHPDRILVIYGFKNMKNMIIYDIKTNDEVNSFASREDDVFKFFAIGPEKQVQDTIDYELGDKKTKKPPKPKAPKIPIYDENGREDVYRINEDNDHHDDDEDEDDEELEKYRISHTGYLMFDKYYVNCSTMIPTPFMKFDDAYVDIGDWISGPRINSDESLVLVYGQLYSSYSYQDIVFRMKRDDYKVNKTDVVKYFVNRKSIAFDFVMEDHKLHRVIDMLESDPLYLLMILTPDNHNKTPLDEAITNNSPKIVELFLTALIKVGEFKLSNSITSQFLELFDMGVEAFRMFLGVCYFTTEQMDMMKKMSADRQEGIYRWPASSSILDEKFNKTFLEDKKIIKAVENKIDDDEDNKGLESSEDEEDADKDEETLLSDISIPQLDEDNHETDGGPPKMEKRVEVKAIEFDWMLTSANGEQFLERLRKTDNLGYFEIEVIKDLIMFQWGYFLPRIIIFLFIPFMLFFLMFVLYTTWVLDEMFNETDDNGNWHVAAFTLGICILVFQLFFIYVEIHQMFFHKLEYFKSFWNVLDITSIILNTAVVVMHLSNVKEEDLNAVSCIAVLVLWFRLFYLLRVFAETAYLISMIQAIILEMKYFVLALLIAILAFANTFYILGRNDPNNFAGDNVWDAFIFSYKMGLGDFDTANFGTVDEGLIWTLWFLNTLIILIILLNLVIAIMGDTFDRVQETQESTMLQEFASIMRENEFLISRKRLFRGIKYMVIVQPEKAEGGVTTSWEGKLNQLKRFLEDSSEKHIVHLKKMEKKLEKMIEFGLEEKLKPLEDKINQKITSLEIRLQKSNKMFNQYPVKELLEKVTNL